MADNKSKIFNLSDGLTVSNIGHDIETFLKVDKEMIVEGFETAEGYFIQAKEESTWKKLSGMNKALQVQIVLSGDNTIVVSIGNGPWASKAGAAAAGALLFAPLLATAAIGVYSQNKLGDEIFDRIEKFIMMGGKSITKTFSGAKKNSNNLLCPSCGAENENGTKYCCGCGKALFNNCPTCGASVGLGKKFCPECGGSMTVEKKQICPKCGASVDEGKKFCPDCGSLIKVKSVCPSCGVEVEDGQKFCPECGSSISGQKLCPSCGAKVADGKKFCAQCGSKI